MILFCIYIVAVILLCVIRTEGLPDLPRNFMGIPLDKVAHFIMFLPFPVLGYLAFTPYASGIWRKIAVLGIICLIGCCFAYSTEKLQSFTAYRKYELVDMSADMIGIATGALAILINIAIRHK